MRSPPSSQQAEVEQPEGLRAKLWRLHELLVDNLLAAMEDPKMRYKPALIGCAIALLKLSDIRVGKGARSAASALSSLKEQASVLMMPFGKRDDK